MWMTLIFYGTAGLFLIWTLSGLWHLRWVRRLPALEKLTAAHSPGSGLPEKAIRCSVVIAARDEEARIEQTIRHLLAQRGVEVECIVVDDMKLGLLLRRAGKRTHAFIGGDDVGCPWGTTAWGMVKIMEKNYFAALDYRVGLVLAGSLRNPVPATLSSAGLRQPANTVCRGSAGTVASFSGPTLGRTRSASPISFCCPDALGGREARPWKQSGTRGTRPSNGRG